MSFIVLIRVSVSPDLCYIFTGPTGEDMRAAAAAAPDRWSDALQVNIYAPLCEGGRSNLIHCLVKVG